ncbi:DUF1631 domain-containing protein [Lysobacter sp. CW239]|uniref:DUF1631 family protein n=1 Tax=Lysobacteraceae TaxID=32033 RepID=UPI000A04EF0E|nr:MULTISPECIES: DUF1631 family protein [Lysobacter]QOD90681.1 DUF1631 domain-containing protein [Lysobacter sp. CW239]
MSSFDVPFAVPAAPAMTAVAMPPRVRRLLEQLQSLIGTELGRELERLLDTLEQDLFRQADRARNSGSQSVYLAALQTLRSQRDAVVPRFLSGLATALANLHEPTPDDSKASSPDVESLRLVDHHEIAEDNVLTEIARRHESRAGLPLLLLGQRFGVLAGQPAFDAARLPVGPQALGRMLALASKEAVVDVDTRLQLYRLFDRQLMAGYLTLVETMNAQLDGANVLPGLAFVPSRRRRHAPGGEHPREAMGDNVSAAAGNAGPAGAAGGGTSPAGTGTGARTRNGPETDRRHGSGHTDAMAGATTVLEMQALDELQQLLARRRELIGLPPQAAIPRAVHERTPEAVPEITPAQPRIALATQEVDAALGDLQAAGHSPRNTTQIRQALLAKSRLQRGAATSLSQQDNETFELLGMLYTEIGRELRQGTRSADLLERLQVPLLRVALQDRGFFVRHQHPARQLLNAVAEAGTTWQAEGEADPRLDHQLDNAVDHVIKNYDGDAKVFASANQALSQHLEAMARKAEVSERRHVEAARGRDKLELAKQRAAESIETAIGDAPLPKFLRTLVDQAWADVLSLVLLRHGEDSEEWREHVEATGQIVAASRGSTAPAWLQPRIEQALGLVGYQGDEATAIAKRLAAVADESDDPATRTELAIQLKARARLGDSEPAPAPPPATPRNAREEACYAHLRSLPFGSWIEFATNQQGDMVRRRLAWFSPVTGRALLVNQRGQRIDDARGHDNLDQIARLIAIGEARVVAPAEPTGLVDRAWQATMGTLRSLTGRDLPQETP